MRRIPADRVLWGHACIRALMLVVLAGACATGAAERSETRANGRKITIFDQMPKTIIVNGYSTSFQWPRLLQRKLDRYFNGKRVLSVVRATKGGTPIAKWMDVETGEPKQPWLDVLRPGLRQAGDKPVIVLAQQSLQWVFGRRTEGIRSADDAERIKKGADALEKYARLLTKDGADLIFVAMHIYKHPMEPAIGNERYALDGLMRRDLAGVERGPDVWTPTKSQYPRAFAADGVHPNALGADILAQKWFEALLRYDGLEPSAGSQDRRAEQTMERDNFRLLRDIPYVPNGHERQKLDLYLPGGGGSSNKKSKPLPLLIWVHGGAWRAGSKEHCPARRFLSKGYAVASVNYRLSQHAIFPAQIQDCKTAVRWLRRHAGDYGIDPDRFGVWGASAGGHLVALLGTAGDVEHFDVGEYLNVSSRVQAVCDFFGPTDFTKMSSFWTTMDHDAADSPESRLVGGPVQQNKAKCRAANPITYASKDDPPFLICHGDKDPLVPHNQSEIFAAALDTAGVEVTFHTVKGGGHGFKDAQVDHLVEQFFQEHLKHGPTSRK